MTFSSSEEAQEGTSSFQYARCLNELKNHLIFLFPEHRIHCANNNTHQHGRNRPLWWNRPSLHSEHKHDTQTTITRTSLLTLTVHTIAVTAIIPAIAVFDTRLCGRVHQLPAIPNSFTPRLKSSTRKLTCRRPYIRRTLSSAPFLQSPHQLHRLTAQSLPFSMSNLVVMVVVVVGAD